MKIAETDSLTASQKENLRTLWNNEYPEKLKHENLQDLENYLDGLEHLKHLLLTDDKDEISGWAFSFQRNSETWFAIILQSGMKNMGYGTMLLDKLKQKHSILNGWVIDHNNDRKENNEIYFSPLAFYLKNNFVLQPTERIKSEKISAVKIQWKR